MTHDQRNLKPECQGPHRRALNGSTLAHSSGALCRVAFAWLHPSAAIRRSASVLAALLLLLTLAGGRAADAPQPGRFLLIFEMSPTLEKNLPQIRRNLEKLFANNLQHEIQDDDDLGVWTVDQSLHTGKFSLASWSPSDSAMYAERLNDFLDQQKSSRHASLANIQPLLNRVAKNSERLTVLLFCDSNSRLLGTPYDSGVNEIITNTAARAKSAPIPLILVLRAYHGLYLGCSVNRSETLNFPEFPPPPKPVPPPAAAPPPLAPAIPAAIPAPPPVVRHPAVPVPSLIIVGTNVGTDLAALNKLASASAVATNSPPTNSPPTNETLVIALPSNATVSLAPGSAPHGLAPPTVNSLPSPAATLQKTSPPAPVAAASRAAAANLSNLPAVAPLSTVGAVTESQPADARYRWPWVIGGVALAAAGLAGWLVMRARRPQSSLITSSMQDDLRLPPRK